MTALPSRNWSPQLEQAMQQRAILCGSNPQDLAKAFRNRIGQKQDWKGIAGRNGKGCDIGYALAASSCEEANSVDACTVTALDATTAFAVPNPG
jgi:hypothetical protein